MAVKAFSQTVTTTRAAITIADTDSTQGRSVWLYGEYHGSSNKCAIGGDDVTMSNGLHIYGGEKVGPINLGLGETLYVVSDAAGGIEMRVLVVGA
jgi:hypothetical protein